MMARVSLVPTGRETEQREIYATARCDRVPRATRRFPPRIGHLPYSCAPGHVTSSLAGAA
jgi:hypothetical protein